MVMTILPMFLFSLILVWACVASAAEYTLSTTTLSDPAENRGRAQAENCVCIKYNYKQNRAGLLGQNKLVKDYYF